MEELAKDFYPSKTSPRAVDNRREACDTVSFMYVILVAPLIFTTYSR